MKHKESRLEQERDLFEERMDALSEDLRHAHDNGLAHDMFSRIFQIFSTKYSQHPRTDLNKKFLPTPKTTTARKLIPHRSNISKN